MAKISEVGRSKTQDTPPDHGTNTEHDPLLEGQPVEYIKHVGIYMSSSRNAAYDARGSADNPREAAQTHSRDTNVECGAVVPCGQQPAGIRVRHCAELTGKNLSFRYIRRSIQTPTRLLAAVKCNSRLDGRRPVERGVTGKKFPGPQHS